MSEKKRDTILYNGLGFPIRLINVPMRKAYGEWILDIDFNQLQVVALLMLVKQNNSFSGKEIAFIRHYFDMSTVEFGKLLGVSHVAVLKWVREERKMNVTTEIFLRSCILNQLKVTDKDFRRIYLTFKPEVISKRAIESIPLEIDADKIAC
ncbi:MAG: hypothetical protein JWO53_114 [Chlamydiia bacterium]|nr:hypothetical protein [Chlamydiia bacterium]